MLDCLLTVNVGSSSVKLAVFREAGLTRICTVTVTGIGGIGGDAALRHQAGGATRSSALPAVHDHDTALAAALGWIAQELGAVTWRAVAHRVVHGGDHRAPLVIDDAVRASIEALVALAPLHQPHNLAGIAAAARLAPGALPVACFDTSFHRTMPDVARRYAIPRELSAGGIEAYGFHGLSYEYIASALPALLGARADGRVIVLHLGSGASLCALHRRASIATTMGFTPLDGVPMATRCGALDPGVVLHLLEARGMSVAEVRALLDERSGLLGVSGLTGDMQALLASDDPRAAEAVALFVYRAGCAIGALAAALGGLDAVVFTGGIGEHSAAIRTRITDRIAWLGALRDDQAHADGAAVFSTSTSPIALCVVPTDEELMMARHAAALLPRAG